MAMETKLKVVGAKAPAGNLPKPVPVPPKPRVSPGEFVRQVRAEIAKVVWPTRAETIRMTIMVLIMTLILSVFFLGVDQVLGRFVKFLLSLAG